MVFVNVAAHAVNGSPIISPDPHHVAVLDPEFLLVAWGNETDAFSGLFHVAIKPVPAVAVDEQIFLPLVGVQADQIRILRRVRTKTKGKALIKAALRALLAEVPHRVPAFQKAAVLLIAHQGVQDALKLGVKFLGAQVLPVVYPGLEKALSIIAHVGPQVADAPGLARYLRTLAGGVKTLRRGGGTHGQLHKCHTSFQSIKKDHQSSSRTWKASPNWMVSGKFVWVVFMAYLSISVA